ncbi:MAG: DUF2715 domain-containing protein [Spirochaetaceae bacterium]|nr:DUF2715 domain-containing protein [Spirochaetaceae bacterium]
MKKICAFCLIGCLTFASFAEKSSETIIIPSFGLSNMLTPKAQFLGVASGTDGAGLSKDIGVNWSNLTAGLTIGTVKKKGFTFFWDNYVSFLGTVKTKLSPTDPNTSFSDADSNIPFKKGVYYMTNFLFGYTFKLINRFYINICAGLHAGIGASNMSIAKIKQIVATTDANLFVDSFAMANVGVPIQLGFAFYFANAFGIEITACDVLGYGISGFARYLTNSSDPSQDRNVVVLPLGFTNTITVRAGLAFKF